MACCPRSFPAKDLDATVQQLAKEIASRHRVTLTHAKIAGYTEVDCHSLEAMAADELIGHRQRFYMDPLNDVGDYLNSQKGGGNLHLQEAGRLIVMSAGSHRSPLCSRSRYTVHRHTRRKCETLCHPDCARSGRRAADLRGAERPRKPTCTRIDRARDPEGNHVGILAGNTMPHIIALLCDSQDRRDLRRARCQMGRTRDCTLSLALFDCSLLLMDRAHEAQISRRGDCVVEIRA